MEGSSKTKLIVIGGGPGGYPAAFLAADLGMDVTLVDITAKPGGVCLHRGCIPSKALLHVARVLTETAEAAEFGVNIPAPKIDLEQLRQWKNSIVDRLTGNLAHLREQRKVAFVHGRGRIADPHTVVVDLGDGQQQTLTGDFLLIATGSFSATLPGLPDDPRIMNSDVALEIRDVPGTLLIVGGGYIGLELGTVYAALGSKVTVVERAVGLLPNVDRDLVELLVRRLRPRFDKILLDTKVLDITPQTEGLAVRMVGLPSAQLDQPTQRFDKVLISVGRRPASSNLGLENTRVKLDDRGFIRTDRQRRTDEPSIFAVGDVAGDPQLAHKATYEARIAVEAMAGLPTAFDPAAIPAVVFTDPEIAYAGLTEDAARAAGSNAPPYKIARFPWTASGRATTLDRNDGLTKLVLDALSHRVLGVGMVGLNAGELIAEGVLAIEMGARAEDLQLTIHAHPTLSETMMEAAEVYFGQSPHMPARKR
jgi:dihydrolipoamide dehydrogenase